MPIVRLSQVKDRLYAPDEDGDIVRASYDPASRAGLIGTYKRPIETPPPAPGGPEVEAIGRHLGAAQGPALRSARPERPVVVMVHGFLFDPEKAIDPSAPKNNDNPHGRVFHLVDEPPEDAIREHTTSWPLGLGFDAQAKASEGVAVCYGWLSSPGFARSLIERFQNFYARAYDYAQDAAWGLLRTLEATAAAAPKAPIDIVCHSLGSAVVVRAIAIGAKHAFPVIGRLGRVVLLGGSEYTGEANLMYGRVEAMQRAGHFTAADGPHFYNIVSRENAILDLFAENFGPKSFFSDTQVIGHNGLFARPRAERWMDLQIDGGKLRDWLGSYAGLDVSGDQPGHVWDHWYYYTYPGNMVFYRDILRDRPKWEFAALRRERKRIGAVPEGVPVGMFGD
jgi:hypothetical protein